MVKDILRPDCKVLAEVFIVGVQEGDEVTAGALDTVPAGNTGAGMSDAEWVNTGFLCSYRCQEKGCSVSAPVVNDDSFPVLPLLMH